MAATIAVSPKTSSHRIPTLDGLRTIAILSVLFFHYFQLHSLPENPYLRLLARTVSLRQTGVDLFFVLSGFLITGILLRARHRANGLRRFYLRRAIRIFPLYYVALFLWFGVLPLLWARFQAAPFGDQWWYWGLLQDVADTIGPLPEGVPSHLWSLAVEEHFYLLWPLVVMKCPERRLPWVAAGLMAASLLLRLVMISNGLEVFYFTFCRMDPFAAGAIVAVLHRRPGGVRELARKMRPVLWVLGPVAVTGFALFTGSRSEMGQVVKYSAFATGYGIILILCVAASGGGWVGRLLDNRFCTVTARWSYALFVFHPLVFEVVLHQLPPMHPVAGLLLAFGAAYAVAIVSWHLLEAPMQALRDRLDQRKPTPGGDSTLAEQLSS